MSERCSHGYAPDTNCPYCSGAAFPRAPKTGQQCYRCKAQVFTEYRCMDCDGIYHRECLRIHCAESNEKDERLAAAEAALAVRVELLARADGLLSLIYHRYQYEKIPHDIRENMLRTSYELRALTDAARRAPLP